MNQSKTMVITSLTLFLLNHLNFGNQLIISWKNKCLGVWNPRCKQSYVCLLLGFETLKTYVSNLENKFCFFSAFAIKCYMSPSSLPILKPQLGTFFATENEKECGEGVTQCQRYIGEFLWILNYPGFNSKYCISSYSFRDFFLIWKLQKIQIVAEILIS